MTNFQPSAEKEAGADFVKVNGQKAQICRSLLLFTFMFSTLTFALFWLGAQRNFSNLLQATEEWKSIAIKNGEQRDEALKLLEEVTGFKPGQSQKDKAK